ncbi:MAG TPA: mechanosensitive ion channel domain-containing protein, partial [candidate division Zixibacteria bacterium]|nr:mechanosensitive ion channel domain-containing protein [candidate division Zixibacteria bacterium]
VVGALAAARFVLERRYGATATTRVRLQVWMLGLTLVALVLVIMILPISEATRGQLLTLLGILLSAAIALSATTFVGNAMAGLMLRAVRSFRPGDFIRVGEHFGRVTERGLFHIEIQTEDRDLITLPNLYLVTNPVRVVRSSGTMITADVSLGYDVPRTTVEEALNAAALAAELSDPYTHVVELGDFSVTYRVYGLLAEVKQYISARSRLRELMLDRLHEAGVEIVSPTFMNTRALAPERKIIPRRTAEKAEGNGKTLESVVFDKAEAAESLEELRERREAVKKELEQIKKDADERGVVEPDARRARLESRLNWLETIIKARESAPKN